MRHWRRVTPMPGQSRPSGLFLERIPVHEVKPLDAADNGNGVPPLDGSLDRVDEQLAALREMLAGLGIQLEESKAESAERLATIHELVALLKVARQVLKVFGADLIPLTTPKLPAGVDAWNEDPVTEYPARR
jgi:hypothetical protein